MRRLTGMLAVVAVTIALTGCAPFPRDPDGTLERVSGGELRVGVVHDPPWADVSGGKPSGTEVSLVLDYAESIDADVTWSSGGEERLIRDLSMRKLDLVIGGLTSETPWIDKVGVTRPYEVETTDHGKFHHILAVPMGENAFLVSLETFLHERNSS